MLFGYPIEAVTQNNWLHVCFGHFMESIHKNLSCGSIVTDWFEVIPEQYRDILRSRLIIKGGLGDKLNAYQIALAKLTLEEQDRVLRLFNEQNKIDMLLSCQCNCDSITDLPENIKATIDIPLKNLFEYAFNLLTKLEIRDRHYYKIYKSIPNHVCPFCGCEKFSAPYGKRDPYDHYLLIDLYPFAGVNLRNLVPMGHKCNSQHKHIQNILCKNDGTRRKSFDPYNHNVKVELCLNNSQPFAGMEGSTRESLPKWEIEFTPVSEEIDTWDNVFHIRERYIKDELDAEFKSWLKIFSGWYQRNKKGQDSDQDLINAIEVYAIDREAEGFGEQAFLKAAVFRMLHIHCKNGDQRLIQFIQDIVNDVSI
jgi:hypothetical protein